jgi:hypothetical protein
MEPIRITAEQNSIERAWHIIGDRQPKAGRKNKGVARLAKQLRREEAEDRNK